MFLETNLAAAVEKMLSRMGLEFAMVGRICSHPGGAKVIDALEAALAGYPLDLERDVLRDHGNMSAPTVFFVLDRLIARASPSAPCSPPGTGLHPLCAFAARRMTIWPAIVSSALIR